MDETTLLHLAAASLVGSLDEGENPGNALRSDAPLTDAQLEAIRSLEPQDIKPTRSFRDLLGG